MFYTFILVDWRCKY